MIFTIGIGLQYLIKQYNAYKEKKEERERQEREERLKIEKEMELAKANNNQRANRSPGETAAADNQPTAGTSNGSTGENKQNKQTYCGFKKGFLL